MLEMVRGTSLAIGTLSAVLTVFVGRCFGEVLWDNWAPPSPYSVDITSQEHFEERYSEAADDFFLESGSKITGARVLLFVPKLLGPSRGVIDHFRIRIYSDRDGAPGESLFETTAKGGAFPATENIEVSLVFTQAFSAAPGVRYWLSLQAELVPTYDPVRWRESIEVHGQNARYLPKFRDSDGNFIPLRDKNDLPSADLAWKLEGEVVPDVAVSPKRPGE